MSEQLYKFKKPEQIPGFQEIDRDDAGSIYRFDFINFDGHHKLAHFLKDSWHDTYSKITVKKEEIRTNEFTNQFNDDFFELVPEGNV